MIQDITGIDVTTVPLDDKETMAIFLSPKPLGVTSEQIMCETGTLGVPEFGTPFTISMLVDTKPKTFAELVKSAAKITKSGSIILFQSNLLSLKNSSNLSLVSLTFWILSISS
jgi:hypothetical protein